jgi:GT2 family glycosyltransferase
MDAGETASRFQRAHPFRRRDGMSGGIGAVVVSHDSAADLPRCLQALLAADAVDRVVVVDNASGDGSREIPRGIADRRLTLLAEAVNTGFAGGCNRGYRELAPEVDTLAFLNPDVEVADNCLSRCAETLSSDLGLGGVAPRLMRPDGETVDSVGQVLAPFNLEVRDRGYGRAVSPELLEPRPVLAPCGALAVYRRQALASVAENEGPWAQHYFCFWEDLELGWRLCNHGWMIRTCPGAVATHGRGAGAEQGSGPLRWRRPPELEACIVSNRWMTLIRHLHPLDLLPRLPLLLLWDPGLVVAGALRRPAFARALRRRWPIVAGEWRDRRRYPRRRLRELT